MAAIVHAVMWLLLPLSLISTGVNGEGGLIFAERAYDVRVPCEQDSVCYHIWQMNMSQSSNYIAIVRNGEIQTAPSQAEESKCILQIKDLTAEDVGRHRCRQRPVIFPYNIENSSQELNLKSGKTVTLQCILLTFVEKGHCYAKRRLVILTWVDEADAEILEDSHHQIKQESLCDVTLTVALQSAENKKFRCQATVGRQVQTSVALRVRLPGRGKAFITDLGPENQGGSRGTVGIVVGAVACVVLTALVALFVLSRRRTNSQLQNESGYTPATDDVMDADNVIYANIILPVGLNRVWVGECETTEYACVR